jgi:Protein of unknown function (DUF3540)
MQALNIEQELFGAAALQFTGRLAETTDGVWRVDTQHGDLWARTAVSCLVQPMAGDLVAVWAPDDGDAFIIAVLDRPPGAKTTVRVDGDLDIRVDAGRFSVMADRGVAMETLQDMSLKADEVSLFAKKWRSVFSEWLCAGRDIVTRAGSVTVIANTASSVVNRLVQRSRHSLREVEQLDQARCGQMDYRADHTMSLRAKNTLITAEKLVKADGDQIHLG